MKMKWTQAAIEVFGLEGSESTTVQALREHCQGCGFDVPDGLRDAPGRLECDAPSMANWTGTAPKIAGDHWILAQ